MASEFKIEDVDAALIAALGKIFNGVAPVRGICGEDINEQGDLVITRLPAVLVLYEAAADTARELKGLYYQVAHTFTVICGQQNLRSHAAERSSALALISTARAGLAGLKLQLADGSSSGPLELGGIQRWQYDRQASWYALTVAAKGSARFAEK